MNRIIIPGKLDFRARHTSFMEYAKILKIYSDILGQNYVDHFCINAIPDETGKILIFSVNPQLAYNVYSCPKSIKQDLVLSPSFYKKKEFYFWHECYKKKDATKIIIKKERPYGIKSGAVIMKREQGVLYMLSFATKTNADNFQHDIVNNKRLYDAMGEYCLQKMQPHISKYFLNKPLITL